MPTVEQAVKDYLAAERVRNGITKGNAAEEGRFAQAYMALLHFAADIPCKSVSAMNASDVARYAEQENLKGADAELRLRHVKDFLDYLKKRGWREDSLSVHMKIPRPAVPKGEKQTATVVGTDATKARGAKGGMTGPGLEARMNELFALMSLRSEMDRGAQTEDRWTGRAPIGVAARKTDISARIRELEEEIRNARLVETTASSPADLGAGVKLRSLEDGTTRAYTIVGPFEANPSEGKLSIKSPVGEAVVGKRKGNQIAVKTPSGDERRYRIMEIRIMEIRVAPGRALTLEQVVKDYLAAERARNAKTKSNAEEAQRDSRATEEDVRLREERRHLHIPVTRQEFHRFVRTIGPKKTIGQLNAPDVADYVAGEVRKGGDFEARLRAVKEFLAYLGMKS